MWSRLLHPGPPMPSEMDWTSQAWRQHPLAPDGALIMPTTSTTTAVRDMLGGAGSGTALTRSNSPMAGGYHNYNGSSSYADFGTSNRFAIASGGITIAKWFRSAGWGTNALILTRRHTIAGVDDYINYGIGQGGYGGQGLSVFYTNTPSSYQFWGSDTLATSLGMYDSKWHLLVASWMFGYQSTTTIVTLDGLPVSGSIVYSDGDDSTHTPHASASLTLGASSSNGIKNHTAADIGPTFIYRRKLPLTQHQQLYAPQSRWSFIPLVGTRMFSIPSGSPPITFFQRRRPGHLRVGSRSANTC